MWFWHQHTCSSVVDGYTVAIPVKIAMYELVVVQQGTTCYTCSWPVKQRVIPGVFNLPERMCACARGFS